MKRFLKQILYFTLTVVGLAFLFSGFNLYFIKNRVLNDDNFRLGDSTEVLMVGDSYVGLSLNPNVIPNSVNETILAEHYLYSYTRIKRFLDVNPNLKFVVLGFNISTIAHVFDDGLYEGRNQSHFFKKEFMLLGREEVDLLKTKDLVFIRNLLSWKFGVPTRENLSLIKMMLSGDFTPRQMPFRGGFIDCGEATAVDEYQLRMRIKECFQPDQLPSLAPKMLLYLEKIERLCSERGVQLVLYASPLSKMFYEAIPEFYKKAFVEQCTKIPSDVMLLDYSRFELPDSCFQDVNHTNGTGARIVSKMVAEEILPQFNE